jgi:hypothetical protein
MRRTDFRTTAVVGLGILSLILSACQPRDPAVAAREARNRWSVDLQSWVLRDDASITLTVRVYGPPSTPLSELSFVIDQLDAQDESLSRTWYTIDLSELPRGGPKDMFLTVQAATGVSVEGLAIDLVPHPTAEQAAQIKELQGI